MNRAGVQLISCRRLRHAFTAVVMDGDTSNLKTFGALTQMRSTVETVEKQNPATAASTVVAKALAFRSSSC